MKEELTPTGKTALVWKFCNKCSKSFYNNSHINLMYLTLNPSGPGALFVSISSNVMRISLLLNRSAKCWASNSEMYGSCKVPSSKHPLFVCLLNIPSKCFTNTSLTCSGLDIHALLYQIPRYDSNYFFFL